MLQAGQLIASGDLPSMQMQLNKPDASLDELYVMIAEEGLASEVGGEVCWHSLNFGKKDWVIFSMSWENMVA